VSRRRSHEEKIEGPLDRLWARAFEDAKTASRELARGCVLACDHLWGLEGAGQGSGDWRARTRAALVRALAARWLRLNVAPVAYWSEQLGGPWVLCALEPDCWSPEPRIECALCWPEHMQRKHDEAVVRCAVCRRHGMRLPVTFRSVGPFLCAYNVCCVPVWIPPYVEIDVTQGGSE
jgi:hypothetical protein